MPAAQLLQTEAAVRENKPARHAEQTEAPTLDENLPARQLLQPGAPFCEYVPAAQLPQTEAAAGEKVPAVQSVHDALPIVFLNEPAPHCVHAPPFGPVNPALHEQLLESVLPIGLMAFTGQLAHEETPVMSLYVPAAHKTHMLELTLPVGALVAPGQLVHAAVPVMSLYFPPGHKTQ